MDFTLTDEQEAVRDLAAQILADLATTERLNALPQPGLDRDAWAQFAQAGLLGVALPEADGGAGLGFVAAHLVLTEVGRAAAPVPYWETVVLGALPIARFGSAAQRESLLPGVVDGRRLLTATTGADAGAGGAAPRMRAARTGDGWALSGVASIVPLGGHADVLLVPAATDEGAAGVWLVEQGAHGLATREQDVLGGAPHAEVTLDAVAVGDDAVLGPLDGTVTTWLHDHAAAGVASLTAGLCAGALRLAADYTSRREQFGRPLATFQAVAQRVADAYIDAEGCELTAVQAAWRLTEGLSAGQQVAIAKWWAAEAGHRVLHAAAHVHGGVGVDRDYALARYFERAKQLEFVLGGGTAHLLRIGAALAAEPV